jgi:hypothetical protein
MDSAAGVLSPPVRTPKRGLVGRAAAAAASWSGGKTGSGNDQV